MPGQAMYTKPCLASALQRCIVALKLVVPMLQSLRCTCQRAKKSPLNLRERSTQEVATHTFAHMYTETSPDGIEGYSSHHCHPKINRKSAIRTYIPFSISLKYAARGSESHAQSISPTRGKGCIMRADERILAKVSGVMMKESLT